MTSTEIIIFRWLFFSASGFSAHLIADWALQNDWIAKNKSDFRHPAAWVHGLIHFGVQLPFFQFPLALAIAISHMLIDTRAPLAWWRRIFRQTTEGEMATHVAVWEDQVAHLLIIQVAAYIVARWFYA